MRFDEDGLDLKPEEMIALLDTTAPAVIRCRHYDVLVPCLPRIFTTNLDCRQQHPFPKGASRSRAQQAAIDRRFIQMEWQGAWAAAA